MIETTVKQMIQDAISAHKEGNFHNAEQLYRAILKSQPKHPDANYNLGVLVLQSKRLDEALPLVENAQKANPNTENFWLGYIDALIKISKLDFERRVQADAQNAGLTTVDRNRFKRRIALRLLLGGKIFQQQIGNHLRNHQNKLSPAIKLRDFGKYKEAQDWLNNLIEFDPQNSEALSLLSQVLLLDKKEVEAERTLTKAAFIKSDLPSIYRNKARLLLKQSKKLAALEQAKLAYQMSPEEPESLIVLAACLGANQRDLEALPLIKRTLKVNSNYAEAYANRAFIKLRSKNTDSAIDDLEMTVSLKPHLTEIWKLLSILYYQASKSSNAIEAIKNACKNAPGNTDLQKSLADLLRKINKTSEAITILKQALKLAPEDADLWIKLGVAFQQEKRIADAKMAYKTTLVLNPKSAAVTSNLGAIAVATEERHSALRYFEKVLKIKPSYAQAYYNLANTLYELGRIDEASANYIHAIALKPDFTQARSNLGGTLKELGRLDEGEVSYNQAIALRPDYAEAYSNLGIALQEMGRFDEAEVSYNRAITSKPDYAQAHSRLISLKKFDVQDEQYSQMLKIYNSANISQEQRSIINFALAKACEDLGYLEQAFTHYAEGNNLRKKLLNYDIYSDIKIFARIKSNYPKILKSSIESDKLLRTPTPIFIVGMPRSGTTLVEQIISSHPKVTGAGELPFALKFGLAIASGFTEASNGTLFKFRRDYLEHLRNVSKDKVIITDKMPQNFLLLGLLTASLPETKIVHVRRSPAAVCWANYKHCFSGKSFGYCYTIKDLILYYKLYQNLMEYWGNALSDKIYELDYERLTVDQESETRRLIEYLGLDWDENCLSPENNKRSVATASNVQVRGKIYKGSSEGWRKYQQFLNGAFDNLQMR